jgi:hypothetical protein
MGAAIAAMIVVLAAFYWYSFGNEQFLGFDEGDDVAQTSTRIALSTAALLMGVVFGAFHRLWRERVEQLDMTAVMAGLRSAELWRSLLAAPLVFSGVYAAAQAQPDHVVAFFFAFQTGFFTDSVLQAKMKHQTIDQGNQGND